MMFVSQVFHSTQQSYEDENYQPPRNDYTGPSARRSKFNQSRSQSLGQQVNDDYDPDFPPPPRSNKPKLLPQIPIKIKPSPSLPPTPNKAQQQQAARRTASLEYQESQDDPNYYQETRNKQNVYNEDYNYAYQSTDNLIPTQLETAQSVNEYKETITDVRGTNRGQNQQAYQDQSQYYYGNKQTPTVQIQRPEDEQQSLNRRDTIKKQFQGMRRLESPRLYQQNTDSLESKDDDLRDSFETAMSSVSAQGRQSFNSEFTSVPEQNTMTDRMDQYNNVPVQDKGYSNSTTLKDNKTDRFNGVAVQENRYNGGTAHENRYNSGTTQDSRYKSVTIQEKRFNSETIEDSRYDESTAQESDQFGAMTQDNVDRYNNVSAQDKNGRYNTSSVQEESGRYSSNSRISPSKNEEDYYSSGPGVIGPAIPERNSSRNNSLQLRDREALLSQKASPVVTPTSAYPNQNHNQRFLQRQRESIDSYVDEEMLNDADYSRESPVSIVDLYPPETNALIEPYHAKTPKASSPSPPKRQETLDEEYDHAFGQSFDQPPEDYPLEEILPAEEQLPLPEQEIIGDQPKRKMTAKERWHWAYNKIIHQLNVSS